MERLSDLKSKLNQLDMINHQVVQYDHYGIEIQVIPHRSIYLKYQSHEIQIDPPETYCLLVYPGSDMIKLKRLDASTESVIDLPNVQLNSGWTDLLSDLLSIMRLLEKEAYQSWLENSLKKLGEELSGMNVKFISNNGHSSSGGFEISISCDDGVYDFHWDENGNLHEEGQNSGNWNYSDLEFLKTAKKIDEYLRKSKYIFNESDGNESDGNESTNEDN
jgi:hypothetical protein